MHFVRAHTSNKRPLTIFRIGTCAIANNTCSKVLNIFIYPSMNLDATEDNHKMLFKSNLTIHKVHIKNVLEVANLQVPEATAKK